MIPPMDKRALCERTGYRCTETQNVTFTSSEKKIFSLLRLCRHPDAHPVVIKIEQTAVKQAARYPNACNLFCMADDLFNF